tara:strand:- start:1151 stop:1357 length:207 start_codon:yes stop_codon:yes gene_type:complete
MQVNHYIDFNDRKLIIKRTIKEDNLKPGFDQNLLKEWTMSDTILKKNGVLYCCETIEEAEIISEESLG